MGGKMGWWGIWGEVFRVQSSVFSKANDESNFVGGSHVSVIEGVFEYDYEHDYEHERRAWVSHKVKRGRKEALTEAQRHGEGGG